MPGTALHYAPRDDRLDEVGRDLAQLHALLEAAAEKLLASFMGIHRSVASQQQLFLEAVAAHPECIACSARLEALREDITRHVGEAIAGLQFQDMSSQLIHRMGAHLGGVCDGDASDAQGAGAPVRGARRRVMEQRHMESGEIELF
jgi:hypothetical protein